jgi:Cof subfamily protein (haloacid dehalogenase superfamily)
MAIRLLAIDLDGTLVNERLEIDKRDIAAVRAASAVGVEVVIATGRMFKSSLPYAQQLGLRGPIINYQGAVVREIATGQVLYRCELTPEMQRRVLEFAEPRDWHVNAYVDETVYTARERPEADLYQQISLVPYNVVGPLSKWVHGDATKMVLVDTDASRVPAKLAELTAWMGPVAKVTRSLDWFIEVINPEVSKAKSLAMVAERLKVPRSDVCAIGDNKNDEEMIAWAGWGVAMGSAPPEVKQIARYVTGLPDQAGVAQAIDRLILSQGRTTERLKSSA